jgi:thiosulfate/3-mercaptopyruvate sulfurtransferase
MMRQKVAASFLSCSAPLFLVAALVVTGCQTKPTKTSESAERRVEVGRQGLRPIEITEATVIVDARPAFEYSTAHIPKSVPLQWADFTEPEPAQKGIVQADTYAVARRLARVGIGPDTHVVVVGRGTGGNGEEGRIAWMLSYLGVTNVQFAAIDSLKPRYVNTPETKSPPAVPIWKPVLQESLNATRDELLFAINQRGVNKATAYRKGQTARLYKILDVRTEKAYLGKEGIGALKHIPNMDALNVPWTQFFTSSFRPAVEIANRLKAVNVSSDHRILVLDENGVSSAAVTMALRAMGFENAANVSGGLADLMSSPSVNGGSASP